MEKEPASVDTSATSDTIVDMASRLRVNDEGAEVQETTSTGDPSLGPVETSASVSDESNGAAPAAPSSTALSPTTTKVYYHIDVEEMPYCTEVQVPPDKITLGDFKRMLNRSNFKYYCKAPSPDPAVFSEVKVELRDDDERLRRSAKGHFELFLQTTEGSTHSDGSSGQLRLSHHHIVPGPAPTRYPLDTLAYRRAVQQFDQSLASTDSESIISEMRALPMNLRTGISRRQYQPHYLLPS